MVVDNDDAGCDDEDGDGIPDEVEDVGAVLFMQNETIVLTWQYYSDCVFAGGDDMETGMKREEGWRAFTEEVGLWEGLSKKDQTMKNNLIFMAVDKMDKVNAAAVRIQANFRGNVSRGAKGAADKEEGFNSVTKVGLDAHADKANSDFVAKSDRQLSRVEFMNAIVKSAIEK